MDRSGSPASSRSWRWGRSRGSRRPSTTPSSSSPWPARSPRRSRRSVAGARRRRAARAGRPGSGGGRGGGRGAGFARAGRGAASRRRPHRPSSTLEGPGRRRRGPRRSRVGPGAPVGHLAAGERSSRSRRTGPWPPPAWRWTRGTPVAPRIWRPVRGPAPPAPRRCCWSPGVQERGDLVRAEAVLADHRPDGDEESVTMAIRQAEQRFWGHRVQRAPEPAWKRPPGARKSPGRARPGPSRRSSTCSTATRDVPSTSQPIWWLTRSGWWAARRRWPSQLAHRRRPGAGGEGPGGVGAGWPGGPVAGVVHRPGRARHRAGVRPARGR